MLDAKPYSSADLQGSSSRATVQENLRQIVKDEQIGRTETTENTSPTLTPQAQTHLSRDVPRTN